MCHSHRKHCSRQATHIDPSSLPVPIQNQMLHSHGNCQMQGLGTSSSLFDFFWAVAWLLFLSAPSWSCAVTTALLWSLKKGGGKIKRGSVRVLVDCGLYQLLMAVSEFYLPHCSSCGLMGHTVAFFGVVGALISPQRCACSQQSTLPQASIVESSSSSSARINKAFASGLDAAS